MSKVSTESRLRRNRILRTSAIQHALVQLSRNVEFLISPLGAKAGSLGVAMLAARDLFEVEHLNPSAFV